MKRALLATAATAATVALLVPLVATAHHQPGHQSPAGPNPDLTIASDPGIVTFGVSSTISGRLRGADNAGKTIELGENPFPFRDTDRFKAIGTTTTDANGDYSFQVTPQLHTIYRVRTTDADPEEVSGPALVRVRMQITRQVDDRTPERGSTVTFSGKVIPEHDDLNVLIQRRRATGTWRTFATVGLEPGPVGEDSSVYTAPVTIKRDGVWRAKVRRDTDHLGDRSRRVRINAHG